MRLGKLPLDDRIVLSITVGTKGTQATYKLTQLSIAREDKPFTGSSFLRHSVAQSILVLTGNPLTGLNNLQLSKEASCLLNHSATNNVR